MKKRELAAKIVRKLREGGFEAYWAGGSVRDMLLGQEPKDYDIATSARPEETKKLFHKTIPVGEKFGVLIVVLEGENFEVATFRTEGTYSDGRRPDSVSFSSAKEDVLRRDFTINGLLWDPLKDTLLDDVEGKKDIEAKRIRTIGDPVKRFKEDKLRLLRAVRFASTLSFQIEEETYQTIRKLSPEIHGVSPERIRDELIKIFTRPGGGRGLELLSESGLLKEILPEVEAMKGVQQPKEFHPEGDVFTHTRIMMDQLRSPTLVLAFASLFHDVGKPLTYEVADRIRFNQHAEVGAELTEKILTRLRFSNEDKERIVACVHGHMRFKEVQKMRPGKLKRLLQRETFQDELELHRIDCLASHGHLENWEFLNEKLQEYSEEEIKPRPLLTGKDLLALGFPQGPLIGKILSEINDRQLEGELVSREEALQWVKTHYPISS